MFSRVLLVVVGGALMSAPAPALAVSDFWQAKAEPDGSMRYACGETCAQTQLICLHEIVPNREPVPIEEMADEAIVPWGQMDFSLLARVSSDRAGLSGAEKIVDGKRSDGPAIVPFGGADWVLAHYQMQAKAGTLAADLMLWPDAKGVAMLRCSYNAGLDDEGSTLAIRQLAESLRLTP